MTLITPMLLFASLLFLAALNFTKEVAFYRTALAFGTAFLLVLVTSLRAPSVGRDYTNYQDIFHHTPNIYDFFLDFSFYTSASHMEAGFLLLVSAITSFTSSDIVFFGLISLITLFIVTHNLNKYTPYPLLGLLVYFSNDFYMHNWVAIRYGVAAALGLFLIAQLTDKRHYSQAFTIAAATLFHTSGLALLFSYGYHFITLTRKKVLLLLGFSVIFGSLGMSRFFLHYIPGFIPRAESLQTYYRLAESLGVLDPINIFNVALLLFFIALWGQLSRQPFFLPAIYLFTLSTCIRIAFHDAGFLAGRISGILGLSAVVLIPLAASAFKQKWVAWFVGAAIAGMLFAANIIVMERYQYDFVF